MSLDPTRAAAERLRSAVEDTMQHTRTQPAKRLWEPGLRLELTHGAAQAVFAVLNQPDIPILAEGARETLREYCLDHQHGGESS